MSVNRLLLPLLALALLVASGCRSHKEASRPSVPAPGTAPADSAPSVVVDETVPTYIPHYYTANFSGTAQGYTANGQIRIQSDSIIWISGSKVVELARAQFTPDSAIIYAKILNRCFKGTYLDLYRRFHYRTSFDELYRMLLSDDADAQLSAIISQFGLEATLHIDPLKEVDRLNFPMSVPAKVNPL